LQQRKRQLILLGALILVGMLGTSFASFMVSRSSLRDQLVHETLPLLGNTIYSEIQRDLLRPVVVSSLMANNTFVHDWVAAGETAPFEMQRYLKQVMSEYDVFSAFFVSEKTGYYYHPTGVLKKVKKSDSRDDWYFRLRDLDVPYELNTDPDLANGDKVTVFVNFRVTNTADEFIGAIGVGLTIESLTQMIDHYSNTYQRLVYFTDQEGKIKLSPKEFSQKHDLAEMFSASSDSDELALQLLSSREVQSLEYQKNKSKIFVNSRFIEELDWFLIVEEAEQPTLARISTTLLMNLAISLAIAAAIMIVAHRVLLRYQRRLEYTAHHDALTGVYNRRHFEELLEAAMKTSARRSDQLSLMFIDIDHFKSINDRFGHATGDEAIRHVTRHIQGALRSSDVLCRWGGEEFCVMLPDTTQDEAIKAGWHLVRAIEAAPLQLGQGSETITVSVGVAERWQEEAFDPIVQRADMALYLAKRSGRNQVQIFKEESLASVA